MNGFMLNIVLAAAASAVASAPEAAQPGAAATPTAVAASPALERRADDLVRLLNGEMAPDQLFTAAVLAQMPAQRVVALAAQIRSRRGRAIGVSRIEASSPNIGTVYIDFERSQMPLRIGVEQAAPHLIGGLTTGGQ